MTTPFENFVNIALGKSVSADVTLPTADEIPVFTGIGRQVTGKTATELGLALSTDLDSAVTKVWKDQGNYDVSGGTAWPTSANTIGEVAIKAGFLWVVTNAGTGTTLTGGVVVSNGDTLRALIDDAGNNAAHWGANEANLGYTPENVTNKKTSLNGGLTSPDDTTYPTTKVVDDALDLKADLSLVGNSPPAYTASVVYAVGQLVTHLGHVWSIAAAHTGAIPFVNGNLELVGSLFSVIAPSFTYACQRLSATALSDRTYDITLAWQGTYTIDLNNAPRIVTITNTSGDVSVGMVPTRVTLSRSANNSFSYPNASSATGPITVDIPAGATLRLLNYDTYTQVLTSQLNAADSFKIWDVSTPNVTTQKGWLFSGTATAGRTITLPNANVDLGIVPNATSSTLASGTFVYATGMGSVVKTLTSSSYSFNIDALATNRAHSVTIRSNADISQPFDTGITFDFVSTKSLGASTEFCDESGVGSLGTCSSGSPFTVTLAPNESWEVRYMGVSGSVDYFSVKRNFTLWTAIPADSSVTLVAGFDYIATNTSTGKTYTLPITPSIGTIVRLKCNNFVAYNQTLARNGSAIDGVPANITLNRNGTYTFIYNALSTWETSFEDSVYLDANVISGTRTRILGGSSNTVSGTDNVMIGCDSSMLSTTGVTAIGVTGFNEFAQYDSLRNGAVVVGSNLKTYALDPFDRIGQSCLTIYTNYHYIGDYTSGSIDVTTDGSGAADATTCIPLHLYSAFVSSASVHEVEVVIMHGTDPGGFGGITPIGCVVAKRRVSVFKNSAGTSFTSAVETVGTDVSLGTVSTTYTITLQVDAANNRVFPRITKTGGSAPESRTTVSCTCKSHYTNK